MCISLFFFNWTSFLFHVAFQLELVNVALSLPVQAPATPTRHDCPNLWHCIYIPGSLHTAKPWDRATDPWLQTSSYAGIPN